MKFIFIHQNFPAQYVHLAPKLVSLGHHCIAIGNNHIKESKSITTIKYSINSSKKYSSANLHPWTIDIQTKFLRAEAVAKKLLKIKKQGFIPDLIIGHSGWGELIAVKDIFPNTPVLNHFEFIYQISGADTNFDKEFSQKDWFEDVKIRIKRYSHLMTLHDMDHAITPTKWQASTAPEIYSKKISIIHEGIDTNKIRPNKDAFLYLKKADLRFTSKDQIITYVARNLEPYRGFHVFMRMLPILQQLNPNCHVIIVGGDSVSYGNPPSNCSTWRTKLLEELQGKLDLSKIHFVGYVPHKTLHNLFQVSSCHVYLTYPFILSWSLLEAMSCEAIVVASDTDPLKEVIVDNKNGFLVDFFDYSALAKKISKILDSKDEYEFIKKNARRTIIENYDLHNICLPKQLKLITNLLGKRNLQISK